MKEIRNKNEAVLVKISVGNSPDSKEICKELAAVLRRQNRRRRAHGDSGFGYIIRIIEG